MFPSSQAYDPGYYAIVAAALSAGVAIPSRDQLVKQNKLFAKWKYRGILDRLEFFYVFAGEQNEFSTFNWCDPSRFRITKLNSPTFTANVGFTGNGSNMSLDTGWRQNIDGISNKIPKYLQYDACAFGHFTGTLDGMLYGTFNVNATTIRPGVGIYLNSAVVGGTYHASGFNFMSRNNNAVFVGTNGGQLTRLQSTPNGNNTFENINWTILRGSGSLHSNCTCSMHGMGNNLVEHYEFMNQTWNEYLISL